MKISLKNILNSLAFLLSFLLNIYGFFKGYNTLELAIYNIYFVVMILTLLLNLLNRV